MANVANTIIQQLKMNNHWVVASWGARNWTGYLANDEHLGALVFRVSGRKFKGLIEIALMPNDTYRVKFFKPWKKAPGGIKVIEVVDGVYFDVLTEVIDRRVEKD